MKLGLWVKYDLIQFAFSFCHPSQDLIQVGKKPKDEKSLGQNFHKRSKLRNKQTNFDKLRKTWLFVQGRVDLKISRCMVQTIYIFFVQQDGDQIFP